MKVGDKVKSNPSLYKRDAARKRTGTITNISDNPATHFPITVHWNNETQSVYTEDELVLLIPLSKSKLNAL